jgi:hypothetical protein
MGLMFTEVRLLHWRIVPVGGRLQQQRSLCKAATQPGSTLIANFNGEHRHPWSSTRSTVGQGIRDFPADRHTEQLNGALCTRSPVSKMAQ